MERSFIMAKPDAVQRRFVAEIIRRFETRGLRLVGMKLIHPSRELAEAHYAVHRERPFFNDLVEFITSGPVVAMVWEGKDIITVTRTMIGATNPVNAAPGTIRGDLAIEMGNNLVHGSDALETAEKEIALWFTPSELLP